MKHQHNRKTQYFKKINSNPFRRRISEDISKQSPDLRPRSQVRANRKKMPPHFASDIWGLIPLLNSLCQVSSTLFFRRTSRLGELFPPPRLQQHKSEGKVEQEDYFTFSLQVASSFRKKERNQFWPRLEAAIGSRRGGDCKSLVPTQV